MKPHPTSSEPIGVHWILRHPTHHNCVCMLTDAEYDELCKSGRAKGLIAQRVMFVSNDQFMTAAKLRART